MTLPDFLDTIYLGDRSCKGFSLDSWERIFKLKVDLISRARGKEWNFYDEEDIEDGYIVFNNVSHLSIENSGQLPNYFIDGYTARQVEGSSTSFEVCVAIVASEEASQTEDDQLRMCMVSIRLHAESMHLEDPKKPSIKIVD